MRFSKYMAYIWKPGGVTMSMPDVHQRFTYHAREDLRADLAAMNLDLPMTDDLSALAAPVRVGARETRNALAVQPMEGCDAETDGTPGEYSRRRYLRFARGGAGLIWAEACAVCEAGRGNPRSFWLHKGNVSAYSDLASAMRGEADGPVYLALQLQHAGRYARPDTPRPVTAGVNPHLDPLLPAPAHIATDAEIDALIPLYVDAARLARDAGFDAVDLKACHGYLHAELLGARERPGRYGGSFENRARGILSIVEAVSAQVAGIDIVSRIGIYDAVPPPHGFCTSGDGQPDFSEAVQLAGALRDRGVRLLNITMGNPYYNPHINRPYDRGFYLPAEHPLRGVARLLSGARAIQAAVPEVPVLASGLSWLREFAPGIAAAAMARGWYRMAGFGRQAFAYPDFARDIQQGGMRREKCCTTCGMCTELMRSGGSAGCVVRDRSIYLPMYRSLREGKPTLASTRVDSHV